MSDEHDPVPLILREPPCGTFFPPEVLELPGIERLRYAIDASTAAPFVHLSGVRFTDVGLGTATVAMPASPWWQTGAGVFAAGVLAFVADSALGGAVLTSAPPRTVISTSEISLNFLRPATIRSQTIIGRGRLIHSTRSLGLSEVFIEDGRGRLLAHGTSRCVLSQVDPATLAARRPVIRPPAQDFQDFWKRPVEGRARGQEYWNTTSGQQAMADAKKAGYRTPNMLLVGYRNVAWSDGEAVHALPASAWFSTGGGTIYGGLLAYLADMVTSSAVATTLPPATAFSPLDLKVNFLRPAFPCDGEIMARATRIHAGRTIGVYTVQISDPSGKLLAVANESVLILPGRPWDKPVRVAEETALEG